MPETSYVRNGIAYQVMGYGPIFVSRRASVVLSEAQLEFVGLHSLKGVPGDHSVFELK